MTLSPTNPGFFKGHSLGKQALRLGALALLLAGLPGCQGITGTNTSVSQVRFVNASGDTATPGLDFYLNNTAVLYNLGFAYSTIDYITIASGSYNVNVAADGPPPPPQILTTSAATFTQGLKYTDIVGNSLANLQETILVDQTQPAPTGQVEFRILDQATKIGAVDLYLIPSGYTILNTLPFRTGITFGVNTGYFNIPAGSYTLAILPTGAVPIASTLTLYTGSQNAYTAGAVNTIILIDVKNVTIPGANIIILNDVPGN